MANTTHQSPLEIFPRCNGPVWDYEDFSGCVQQRYLQTRLPLFLITISLIHLIIVVANALYQSAANRTYEYLKNRYDIFSDDEDTQSDTTDIEDEVRRNAQLALRPTASHSFAVITIERNKPRAQNLKLCVEVLCIAAEILVGALLYVHEDGDGRIQRIANIITIIFWAYVSALTLARLFLYSTERQSSFLRVWNHTACLYTFQWLLMTLKLRTYHIHPYQHPATTLVIVQFSLSTMLLLIVLSSRTGNRLVELEHEGDIPPTREQLATIFSLGTFSWVDSIVWTGYKKTFEMADVWNLVPADKAAAVLSDYRDFKKTTALAWHLLKYFKDPLILQAIWAAFSGLLTFAPTFLLQVILRYVEQPTQYSVNTAWLCVGLLFASGLASALADGQTLWIGRRTCINLRAVIIGEIYSKALKRKVGTMTEKILGEQAPEKREKEPKRGMLGKMKAFDPKRILRKKDKRKEEERLLPGEQTAPEPDETQVSGGAVINLMAVDSFKISEASAYLHFLWASTPVQLIIAVMFLYYTLGYSSIAGIGMMIALLPVNLYVSKQFAAAQTKILAATDARIHTTNEVLSNIRIIKYFAWEERFMDMVNEKRATELKHLRNRYILWSFAATIWGSTPILITLLSFAIYTIVEKKPLIPSVAFPALSLFQILRLPLDQLADMVAHVQESKVSIDRVEEFLNEEDTQKYKQLKQRDTDDSETRVGFVNGTFTWGSLSSINTDIHSSFRLMDLNIDFALEGLNVVAGPTGSGKTSLLMALLGEMTLLEGEVHLPGGGRSREDMTPDPQTGLTDSVAYCAQQAWLVNDTVKQNIVFASPWNEERYHEVVEACSLRKDFDILDAGDETLVGEKGVTLSGGQKQRISLARALYCRARHVLLDDILSAVDSHTAKWIFEHALMGPLMKNRTCILVTHNIALCLPYANFAVYIDNGRVLAQGSANNVMASGVLASELVESTPVSAIPSRIPSEEDLTRSVEESELTKIATAQEVEDSMGLENANGVNVTEQATDKFHTPAAGPAKATFSPSSNALRESKAEGSIKIQTIMIYLRSMGGPVFWVFATSAFVVQQLATLSTNVWIRYWANAYTIEERCAVSSSLMPYKFSSTGFSASMPFFGRLPSLWFTTINRDDLAVNRSIHVEAGGADEVNAAWYLAVYGILGAVYIFLTFARFIMVFYGSLAASKKLHERLIRAVSRAKFRFFDSTPLGQMMNRFSKDLENVDQEVAPVAEGVVHCFASIVTVVILITVITPGFLIPAAFITLLYVAIGRFYISSSRDLKRLESLQRSPLYQQFGETLSGMTTIRAYGDERRFIRENLNRVNTHSRPFIYLWAANRWLAFRVDIAGALVSLFAGIFVMLSVGKLDAGAAGLSLSYAVSFTESVLWFVRLYATNEQNMNSMERIREYLDVDQEAPSIIPDNRPAKDWPSQGRVELVGYSTRYRKDFDFVLRDLTFSIAPCEKIGVVGRTGAGKSSLALALFRALEAEEGKILVDGVDISTIGLKDLREAIVMVPQDPTLFSGTIRSNLDPFGLFTDEEIFTALRRVQLIDSSLPPSALQSRPRTPSTPLNKTRFSDLESDKKQSELLLHSNSFEDYQDEDNHSPEGSGSQKPANERTKSADSGVSSPESSSLGSDIDDATSSTETSFAANKNVFYNLSSVVADSGTNLSQGQRQLLCLARALLKSPKVLLMDEATASIDYATDAKIQETIRELQENTIITIAHRLKTIVDYDRVIVMDHGRIVESGAPWDLLRPNAQAPDPSYPGEIRREGVKSKADTGPEAAQDDDTSADPSRKRWFRDMCIMSGELEILEREAKRSWEAKRLIDDT